MIIERVIYIVEEACRNDTHLGYSIWWSHIQAVRSHSKVIARMHGANEEIVEISALLHDYATIIEHGNYEHHHLLSSEVAEKILRDLNYPEEKVERVKHCILSHRGSRNIPRQTIEAQCLADGDAISLLISPVTDLLEIGLRMTSGNIDEAIKWLTGKIQRSWHKLSPTGKEYLSNRHRTLDSLMESKSIWIINTFNA